MPSFCKNCGSELGTASQFCPNCGASLENGGLAAPIVQLDRKRWGIAGGLLLSAAVAGAGGAWYGGLLDWFAGSADAPGRAAGVVAPPVANSGDRPPEWFAAYRDTFLSGPVIRYTNSNAALRNFPTAKGSMIVTQLPAGQLVAGRLVAGGEAGTQWLKTDDGNYTWTGNLADHPVLPGAAEPGWALSASNARLGRSVIDGQIGDLVSDNTFVGAPTTVVVQFDYANVQFSQPYACALRDANGAVLASFSGNFNTLSGWLWCRFPISEPGNYDLVITTAGSTTWLGAVRIITPEQSAATTM